MYLILNVNNILIYKNNFIFFFFIFRGRVIIKYFNKYILIILENTKFDLKLDTLSTFNL